MNAAVTSTTSRHTIIAAMLLVIAFVVTPVGVYRALEDGGIGHPITFMFFILACLAAIAPLIYGLTRLHSLKRWIVIALDLPFILLVLLQIYRMATRNV